MIGRWLISFTSGMALMSIVLRVAVSNVRMPRSQRMTSRLPLARMYSAASSQSWIEDDMPRFSSTGLPVRATSSSRKKFCALRVPIWRTSAYFAMSCTVASDITSVTTGRPVSARACASSLRPSSSMPRKL